jgi:hypothetical protein
LVGYVVGLGWLFGRLVGSVCWLHAWLSRGSHSSWLFGLLFGWIAVSLEKGLEKMQAEAQKRQLNKKHTSSMNDDCRLQ